MREQGWHSPVACNSAGTEAEGPALQRVQVDAANDDVAPQQVRVDRHAPEISADRTEMLRLD